MLPFTGVCHCKYKAPEIELHHPSLALDLRHVNELPQAFESKNNLAELGGWKCQWKPGERASTMKVPSTSCYFAGRCTGTSMKPAMCLTTAGQHGTKSHYRYTGGTAIVAPSARRCSSFG